MGLSKEDRMEASRIAMETMREMQQTQMQQAQMQALADPSSGGLVTNPYVGDDPGKYKGFLLAPPPTSGGEEGEEPGGLAGMFKSLGDKIPGKKKAGVAGTEGASAEATPAAAATAAPV